MNTEPCGDLINKKHTSLKGKVVLITGATSGIGLATAQALAEKGARVVVIGRDPDRLSSAIDQIAKAADDFDGGSLQADLSSINQIYTVAEEFKSQYDRLDVLINNAGAIFFRRELTVDGFEKTFALNHLNYFLLTNLLLDRLISTAEQVGEARVVNVASDAHRGGKIYFDDLMFEHRSYGIGGFRAYSQSKLANVLFTFELARRLSGTKVSSNALHPGFVGSNFGKNNGLLGKIGMSVAQRLAISPEVAAQTPIYLASWPDVKGVSGKYFDRCQMVNADRAANDPAAAYELWEVSKELVGMG